MKYFVLLEGYCFHWSACGFVICSKNVWRIKIELWSGRLTQVSIVHQVWVWRGGWRCPQRVDPILGHGIRLFPTVVGDHVSMNSLWMGVSKFLFTDLSRVSCSACSNYLSENTHRPKHRLKEILQFSATNPCERIEILDNIIRVSVCDTNLPTICSNRYWK